MKTIFWVCGCIFAAVVVKLLPSPMWEIGFRVNATTHRGVSPNTVVFWILIAVAGALLLYYAFQQFGAGQRR
jgi:hypothetical protein